MKDNVRVEMDGSAVGHAEGCPGCVLDSLTDEDQAWLVSRGYTGGVHRRVEPPTEPSPFRSRVKRLALVTYVIAWSAFAAWGFWLGSWWDALGGLVAAWASGFVVVELCDRRRKRKHAAYREAKAAWLREQEKVWMARREAGQTWSAIVAGGSVIGPAPFKLALLGCTAPGRTASRQRPPGNGSPPSPRRRDHGRPRPVG